MIDASIAGNNTSGSNGGSNRSDKADPGSPKKSPKEETSDKDKEALQRSTSKDEDFKDIGAVFENPNKGKGKGKKRDE